jgi:hypothetical protein
MFVNTARLWSTNVWFCGKVKQSHYRSGQDLGFPWGWGSQISRHSAREGGKVVSTTYRLPLPPGNILCIHCGKGRINPRAVVWPEGFFIHLVVCLTSGPKSLPNWTLHIVRSRASSFRWEYPLLSLRSSSSSLRLHPRLPVTYIPPFIFPSIIIEGKITGRRRQFLRGMWPIQLAFRLLIHVGYSEGLWHTSRYRGR